MSPETARRLQRVAGTPQAGPFQHSVVENACAAGLGLLRCRQRGFRALARCRPEVRRSKPVVPFSFILGPEGSHISRNMSQERSRLIVGRSQWRSRFHSSTTRRPKKRATHVGLLPPHRCWFGVRHASFRYGNG